jgi:hypothetical protein
MKKWYAGSSHNSEVELVGELIDDKERGFKGYQVNNLTDGGISFAEHDRLFDTEKEANEWVFNNQRAKHSQPPIKKSSHILDNLKAKGINETLQNMGVYVVDVETTGLTNKDKMFSAAYTEMDMNTGSPINTKESFFNIRKKLPSQKGLSRNEYIEKIETLLAKSHSSEMFGEAQKARGSLKDAAAAMADNKTTTPSRFLTEFSQELSQNQNGNVVLSHNSQFENNQFERLHNTSRTYNTAYKAVKDLNQGNQGLFGANDSISNWSKNADQAGFNQRIRDAHLEYVRAVKGNTDPALIRKALETYAHENMNLVNYMMKQIEDTKGKVGAYVNIDTLPITRALMAFGALNGDVDPGNLMLGGKIEHQSLAWLGRKELHTAGQDTIDQGEIAKKLFAELEAYSHNPERKSKALRELNEFINKNNVATETFKSSITSEISNTTKYKDKASYIAGVYEWIDNSVERYSIASGDHTQRERMANQIKQEFDKTIRENPGASRKTLANEMESIIHSLPTTFDQNKKGADQLKAITERTTKFLEQHKGKLAIAGLFLAGTMVADGGEDGQEIKYNTYDELYNSQYYGTGFADWQNRNNAHRVLY